VTPRSQLSLAAAMLEALPAPTLLVDSSFRVVHANAAARAALGAAAGTRLRDALSCAETASRCGPGARCPACPIFDAVGRALAGAPARARGFLLRDAKGGAPADLHVLATAAPLGAGRGTRAVLVLEDVDRILLDPAIVRICAGCGRVEDDDGCWYPLQRFLEDRLGVSSESLCDRCERGR
jgi:PAS domain-containing protein